MSNWLNAQVNLVEGLADFLTGPMEADFFTILLMDKGYKTDSQETISMVGCKTNQTYIPTLL